MKKKLKGTPPDVWAMNMALFGTADPDVPSINVNYSKMWDLVKPTLINDNRVVGKAMLVGTGAENNGKDFWELWSKGVDPADIGYFTPATPLIDKALEFQDKADMLRFKIEETIKNK